MFCCYIAKEVKGKEGERSSTARTPAVATVAKGAMKANNERDGHPTACEGDQVPRSGERSS